MNVSPGVVTPYPACVDILKTKCLVSHCSANLILFAHSNQGRESSRIHKSAFRNCSQATAPTVMNARTSVAKMDFVSCLFLGR
jgi:hypothetical protein